MAVFAHRGQLRPRHIRSDVRPNLMLTLEKPATDAVRYDQDVEMEDLDVMRGTGCGEGPFRGFSEQPQSKSRRRKRDAAVADLPTICLRRSKRQRNQKVDSEFVYK